ncbi:hypothetical protein GXP67_29645 [Rhodocytophaga rosea]|uniref:Uncharacterized protein n=1 Tax=Rhodocytophaga rosea TaxID=2704465 RepID=A0A6C0GR26_9BACT|nr:DUF6526 family protein [Rhodocytophaga rosea]QHT70519.1 hypothetical protein GXP67_29645 [Rhodocytophaga rosea]
MLYKRGKQHYGNHKQYNLLYYFILIPVSSLFILLSATFFVQRGLVNQSWMEASYYLLAGVVAIATVILVRQQALITQKRMIRMEMRLRYFTLTGQTFNEIESQLSSNQIAALRFASDTELLSLVNITLEEHLEPVQIKKRIKRWKGDYHQV